MCAAGNARIVQRDSAERRTAFALAPEHNRNGTGIQKFRDPDPQE
jgi:hypothetical protein